jgi:hypothetical protein
MIVIMKRKYFVKIIISVYAVTNVIKNWIAIIIAHINGKINYLNLVMIVKKMAVVYVNSN